jgi:hypothetical protein
MIAVEKANSEIVSQSEKYFQLKQRCQPSSFRMDSPAFESSKNWKLSKEFLSS